MPRIPNFPADLLEEHKQWHHAHHMAMDDPEHLPNGYGQEFLQFHRSFIRRVLSWYNKQGLDPALVAPWQGVPEPIRRASCYDQQAESRILFQPQTFSSADELGRFIEGSGLHGCIHQEAAALYGEPEINDFDVAPRNTVFYNIHGMIDQWYQNWEGLGRFVQGGASWRGKFDQDTREVLRYVPSDGNWWLGRPDSRTQAEDEAGADVQDEEPQRWQWIGDSRAFGVLADGRPFRIWDTDGDGRKEVLFRRPEDGSWWEGQVREGRLTWAQIHVQFV